MLHSFPRLSKHNTQNVQVSVRITNHTKNQEDSKLDEKRKKRQPIDVNTMMIGVAKILKQPSQKNALIKIMNMLETNEKVRQIERLSKESKDIKKSQM